MAGMSLPIGLSLRSPFSQPPKACKEGPLQPILTGIQVGLCWCASNLKWTLIENEQNPAQLSSHFSFILSCTIQSSTDLHTLWPRPSIRSPLCGNGKSALIWGSERMTFTLGWLAAQAFKETMWVQLLHLKPSAESIKESLVSLLWIPGIPQEMPVAPLTRLKLHGLRLHHQLGWWR